ncbi:ABC transporter permease [Micromonospora sp. NPDC005197]|uniref:ABC transporter permease n=1 Tax=unclassified Micromonospora TaxID=2617518 RepID=UPI0033BA190E
MSTSGSIPSVRRLASAALAKPSTGVIVLLLGICVFMAFTEPVFLTFNNWSNVFNQSVYVLILAIGMTVVLITGGIDLSVGAVLGLSAGVMADQINTGRPFIAAFILALAAGAVLGLFNGVLITRIGLPDFVATLATMGIASGLLYLWTSGFPFTDYMLDVYYTLAGRERYLGFVTVPLMLSLLMVAVVAFVMRRTSFGRHAYAVGSNADAARLSGINVNRVRVTAYVISGVLAALAGVLLAGRTTTVAPNMGLGYEVQAIAAAVIGGAALSGGRGRVGGAVLGALVLTVANNVINIAGVSAEWQQIVLGSILLLAVTLDRVGTLGYERSLARARRQAVVAADA